MNIYKIPSKTSLLPGVAASLALTRSGESDRFQTWAIRLIREPANEAVALHQCKNFSEVGSSSQHILNSSRIIYIRSGSTVAYFGLSSGTN